MSSRRALRPWPARLVEVGPVSLPRLPAAYPSGNARKGHALVCSIADAVARLGRLKGDEVLHTIERRNMEQ